MLKERIEKEVEFQKKIIEEMAGSDEDAIKEKLFGFIPKKSYFEEICKSNQRYLYQIELAEKRTPAENYPPYLYKIELGDVISLFGGFSCKFYPEVFEEIRPREMFKEIASMGALFEDDVDDLLIFFGTDKAKEVHEALPSIIEKYKPKMALTYINRLRSMYKDALRIFNDIDISDEEYDIQYGTLWGFG